MFEDLPKGTFITQEEAIAKRNQRFKAAANLEHFLKEDGLEALRDIDTKEEITVHPAVYASILEDRCICGYCERKGLE